MAAQPDKKTVIKDLLELGKSKGQLSTKEILDALGELDFDPEQIEKFYDTLETQGVEIVEDAVEAARENAKLNGLDNCEFIAGDVLKVLDEVPEKHPFLATSCCPAYVEAVRRHAPELLPHVSETATPMHYTAEIARERHPETVTVFIGPCVAKRQEGLHDEMVDYVLTFEEVGALFNARGIVVEECEEHELERPSNEARGYAIAGGVSAAVEKLVGDRFEVRPVAINGLSPQGLKKLQSFVKGGCPGNLVEVMTCVGGCVGGAGVVMPAAKGAKAVENFATKGKV